MLSFWMYLGHKLGGVISDKLCNPVSKLIPTYRWVCWWLLYVWCCRACVRWLCAGWRASWVAPCLFHGPARGWSGNGARSGCWSGWGLRCAARSWSRSDTRSGHRSAVWIFRHFFGNCLLRIAGFWSWALFAPKLGHFSPEVRSF